MRSIYRLRLVAFLFLFVSISGSFAIAASTAAAPEKSILGFSDWKSLQIKESTVRIRGLRGRIVELRKLHPRSPMLPQLQQDLGQELWNLEMARDLSPRDYLLLYVDRSEEKLQQIASALNPDEVGQFLKSYLETLKRPTQPLRYHYPRVRLGAQSPNMTP